MISAGYLNKFLPPVIPGSGVSSAWDLVTWLSVLACKKQHQDLVIMEAS